MVDIQSRQIITVDGFDISNFKYEHTYTRTFILGQSNEEKEMHFLLVWFVIQSGQQQR